LIVAFGDDVFAEAAATTIAVATTTMRAAATRGERRVRRCSCG
jgi:hypothetical protein